MEKTGNLLKGTISILFILTIITFIGAETIKETLSKIKTEYFILTSFFFIASMFLATLAIMPLTKIKKKFKVFQFKAISWSIGLFLPSKIGESAFVFLLKKEAFATKKAIAIFLVDRFVSFSIIGLLSIIAVLKYAEIKINLEYIAIFIVVLSLLLIKKNKIKEINNINKIFFLAQEAENYLKKEKKAIAINYFFSSINFILMFLVIKTLFFFIGAEVGLIDIALISSMALLAGIIPITLNGLGIREGTLVYLYSLVGVQPEYSILVALIFLVASYVMAAVFLALFYSEFSFILKRNKNTGMQND